MFTAEAVYTPEPQAAEPYLKEMVDAYGSELTEDELSRLLRILRDFRADGMTEEAAHKIFECFPGAVELVISAYWKLTA